MWFNNALIYQYELDDSCDLATCLTEERLKPCPPHARFIYGWVPPIADELVHTVLGSSMICLGKEERILPRNVVMRELSDRVKALEMTRGFEVKRAEKAQMAEDIEFELLPKSFCVQKRITALLDVVNKRLIVNTSSANQASQLIAMLRKSVPGIHIEPLVSTNNMALHIANWIAEPASLPNNFQLASDCLLFAVDDEKKRFNCRGYELPAEEILTLLSQGLAAAEVSIIWNERIQFTLTQDLVFKKLKCLDYLQDDFNDLRHLDDDYQQQDASLTLLAGELRGLLDGLLSHLINNETSQVALPAEA